MKQDRFLLGILAGIGLLMILSIGVFLARNNKPEYKNENSPSGVTHNFVVAIYQRDYDKAYSYMAEDPNKPSLEKFRQQYTLNTSSQPGVEILEENIAGDTASVMVNVIQSSNGPFESGYRNNDTVRLVKQGGEWKVIQMPYFIWNYEWYQTPPAP